MIPSAMEPPDQLLVPRLVEDDDPQLAHVLAERGTRGMQICLRRQREVEGSACRRRPDQLLHVERGGDRRHRARGRERDRGHRAGEPFRAQLRALERVDGDIEAGTVA
jgi:hypothetical protein